MDYQILHIQTVAYSSATGLTGSFDMVKDAGMIISGTTARMNIQSKQLFDNATSFYLRNN